jgi:hypothetical protein
MGGYQKTTCSSGAPYFPVVRCSEYVHLLDVMTLYILSTSLTSPRGSEVLQITVPLGKTHCSPYKFKIAGLVKKVDDLGHFWA